MRRRGPAGEAGHGAVNGREEEEFERVADWKCVVVEDREKPLGVK